MKNRKKIYHNYITNECDDSEYRHMSDELKEFDIQEDDNESLRDFDIAVEEDLTERLRSNIHYEIVEKRKFRRRKKLRAVGFVLVLGALMGVFQMLNPRQDSFTSANTFAEVKTTITNNSDTVSVLDLPDASIVRLSPQSRITYSVNYNVRQRNIYLTGRAVFEVSRNPSKPFKVFSGNIVTTAIGTKFIVSEHSDNIFIKLLEGKILVRKNTVKAEDHFLVAGNSINYNIKDDLFTSILRTAKPIIKIKNDQQVIPDKRERPEPIIKLENQPLASALDLIAENYGVEIEYSPLDIQDINIIATLDASKPVYRILNSIALMNNLNIMELDDKQYILSKVK